MNHIKKYNELMEINTTTTNDIFYHGSNIKLDTLKIMPKTSGESKFLGDGIYISNSKEVSDSYGKYTYKVILSEPLNSLQYFEEIDMDKFQEISDKFIQSKNESLNYIGYEIKDAIEDNELWWGKKLISMLEREGLNTTKVLLSLGYNSIESPINKINQFRGRPDSDRNICIIKDNIITLQG